MSVVAGLSERLRAGSGPLFTAWVGMPESLVADALAREAFDCVTIDMQHGAVGFQAMVGMVGAVVGAGKPALVRIPVGEFSTASRALDAGASAIIAPMINSVEDARLFAAATKFPPLGGRSWGPYRATVFAGLSHPDYLRGANGFSLAIAMIETREAMAALDAILDVPGIDGVLIGPGDLSIALSGGLSLDPMGAAVDEALTQILARTRAAGKVPCVFGHSAERAAELAAKGFGLVAVMNDAMILRAGAKAALEIARGGTVASGRGGY